MTKRTKKYNPHKKSVNPYVDFRFEFVDKSNLMPHYNQMFWMVGELRDGKSITALTTKIGDEEFLHQVALKRIFLETYAIVELLRERGILTSHLIENINWLRDRINSIFTKMLEYVKFDDVGVEYWIHTDFSYLPKKETCDKMYVIVNLMYAFWLDNVRNHERAAAMWNGCNYMGIYLENENRALNKLLKFNHFKQELERIFVSQNYLE